MMLTKHLFHISGKKGSGKTTLLNWLSESGHFTTEVRFHLEDAIAKEMFNPDKIPIPFWWTDQMINLCYEAIQEHNLVFLTGLYHPNELSFFKKEYEVHSIGIEVDDILRYERILKRQREKETSLTLEELKFKDQKREGIAQGYKADINSLIKESEIILTNNGTIEDFKKEKEKLLTYLHKQYFPK